MDEARQVLARLERIENLRTTGSEPRELLEEVRALLHEGEAWISAEGEAGGRAGSALERLAATLEEAPPPRAA